jgi:hypothetical protein
VTRATTASWMGNNVNDNHILMGTVRVVSLRAEDNGGHHMTGPLDRSPTLCPLSPTMPHSPPLVHCCWLAKGVVVAAKE